MGKWQKFLFQYIIREQVIQGAHQGRIDAMYQLIRDAFEIEFYEDNAITADNFLAESFNKSQKTDHFKVKL